jgi:hypothetical protein
MRFRLLAVAAFAAIGLSAFGQISETPPGNPFVLPLFYLHGGYPEYLTADLGLTAMFTTSGAEAPYPTWTGVYTRGTAIVLEGQYRFYVYSVKVVFEYPFAWSVALGGGFF